MRNFDPWIGRNYESEGVRGIRLLILGEAHYGTGEKEKDRNHTIEIIRYLGQQKRYRFHGIVQRLVVGGRGWLSSSERAAFWERVAFYNYVQCFPGPQARYRPSREMWAAATAPFLQTVQEVAPQLLLVLGHQLRHHLPQIPPGISVCAVQHPSSRGFKYAEWQPIVQTALDGLAPQSLPG